MPSHKDALIIGKQSIYPGKRVIIDLPVMDFYTHTALTMPVQVLRGKREGSTLFVSAAIHGDEINGVEIVRRLLAHKSLRYLRGTLIAVPIVNVQGFLGHSRYTPDRRDLNRSFPGSIKGSVASRIAHLFAKEIVAKADCGIDLHTAAIHRDNLPQIRANLDDENISKLAESFSAPVMLNSSLREGSLRAYAAKQGIPTLLYEAGEALRFSEPCIQTGVNGIIKTMRYLGMLPKYRKSKQKTSVRSNSSTWMRAESSGIHRAIVALGERVKTGQILGIIADPFGNFETNIKAKCSGIVIGRSNLPLVNEGDAVFHIAHFDNSKEAEAAVEQFHQAADEAIQQEKKPIV